MHIHGEAIGGDHEAANSETSADSASDPSTFRIDSRIVDRRNPRNLLAVTGTNALHLTIGAF